VKGGHDGIEGMMCTKSVHSWNNQDDCVLTVIPSDITCGDWDVGDCFYDGMRICLYDDTNVNVQLALKKAVVLLNGTLVNKLRNNNTYTSIPIINNTTKIHDAVVHACINDVTYKGIQFVTQSDHFNVTVTNVVFNDVSHDDVSRNNDTVYNVDVIINHTVKSMYKSIYNTTADEKRETGDVDDALLRLTAAYDGKLSDCDMRKLVRALWGLRKIHEREEWDHPLELIQLSDDITRYACPEFYAIDAAKEGGLVSVDMDVTEFVKGRGYVMVGCSVVVIVKIGCVGVACDENDEKVIEKVIEKVVESNKHKTVYNITSASDNMIRFVTTFLNPNHDLYSVRDDLMEVVGKSVWGESIERWGKRVCGREF
jgi:hypothetical protein